MLEIQIPKDSSKKLLLECQMNITHKSSVCHSRGWTCFYKIKNTLWFYVVVAVVVLLVIWGTDVNADPKHTMFRDAITFCMFEKMKEPTKTEKRCQEQQSVCRRKELIRK
jgi:hypothetical protein